MCLLIIEVLFFISGVLLLFTGKVPQQLFGVMFGKGVYEIAPLQARLFGLLLMAPLPVVLLVSFLLGLIVPDNAVGIAVAFEVVVDVAVAITAIIIARKSKQAPAPAPGAVITPDNNPK